MRFGTVLPDFFVLRGFYQLPRTLFLTPSSLQKRIFALPFFSVRNRMYPTRYQPFLRPLFLWLLDR